MEKPKIIIELKDLEKKKARLEELIMHLKSKKMYIAKNKKINHQ